MVQHFDPHAQGSLGTRRWFSAGTADASLAPWRRTRNPRAGEAGAAMRSAISGAIHGLRTVRDPPLTRYRGRIVPLRPFPWTLKPSLAARTSSRAENNQEFSERQSEHCSTRGVPLRQEGIFSWAANLELTAVRRRGTGAVRRREEMAERVLARGRDGDPELLELGASEFIFAALNVAQTIGIKSIGGRSRHRRKRT